MENQSFYGSICITDLVELAKKGHSAFSKAENGKVYANINVWLNTTEDKYGNIMALQVNPTKERKEQDGRPYFGNCKKSDNTPKPIAEKDAANLSEALDDLPF